MAFFRYGLALLFLGACTALAHAQRAGQDALVIYHDGFSLRGQVHEKVKEIIYDKASGKRFPILGGEFFIDDRVRNIRFSTGQVEKVTKIDPPKITGVLRFPNFLQRTPFYPNAELDNFSDWSDKGDRTATVRTPNGNIEMKQRVASVTSQSVFVITTKYAWNLSYFTQEFTPEWTRGMVYQCFNQNPKMYKDLKDTQKLLILANIMQEAGWFTEAEKELNRCIDNFPADRKIAQEHLAKLKQVRAGLLVDSVEQASNVGQHLQAMERLESYDRASLSKLVSERQRQTVQDLKTKYAKAKTEIEQAKAYLQDLPAQTKDVKAWTKACEFLAPELNCDTLERLEKFVDFADQYDRDRKAKRKPTQRAEEVLALALTGWLQGKQAAESDPKTALKLSAARQFLLDYLKTDMEGKRASLLSDFKQATDLAADEIARLITMIPPPLAYDAKKLGTDVMTVNIDVPGGNGGSYLVQLPPDYHHLRAYPVLMLFNSGRDKADETLKRFTDEAKKYGFILVAPEWTAGAKALRAGYQYSQREHDLATETLRDVRRRFQIDSDRVFLFGWEDGANMALDVGLGHPDLFAGVVSMNGTLSPFTRRFYWPNAQYLPLYIIEGEINGTHPKSYSTLLKSWSREPYMATYVEYKGRASEWYSAEIPNMLNWMSRKKRHHPIKEMGRLSLSGGLGEEFRSARNSDNRFYWLGTDELPARRQFDAGATTWPPAFQPATFQAKLTHGNKANAKGKAQVWNQIDAHVAGVKQVTFWLESGLMDYGRDLLLRVNDTNVGGVRKIQPKLETLLEELYQNGDRQRLYVAKIEVKLGR